MFYNLENKKIKNSGENWIAPNATIIGDITLEKNTSIWFNATLRGDVENIYVGEGSNIQDGCVLHTGLFTQSFNETRCVPSITTHFLNFSIILINNFSNRQ